MIPCLRAEGRCKGCPFAAFVLPDNVLPNINALTDVVLDPLCDVYGDDIHVNSAYRCPWHNKAVGGAANSQHLKGQAADITAGSPEENLVLAQLLVQQRNYDQVILEEVEPDSLAPRWIHVSWKRGGVNRRVVRKKLLGTAPVYPLLTKAELTLLKGAVATESEKGGAS